MGGRHRFRRGRHCAPRDVRRDERRPTPKPERPPAHDDPPPSGPMIPAPRVPRYDVATQVLWHLAGELRTPAQTMRGYGDAR
ncbi:hypothetical protein JD77_04753 [Micromonospora olivasterospora]|uniref:Uncharacterized protein n=1 Tax=Micromonospora olivasterospora TaxID=1880 RepID=A0A562IFE2_MICOL|nr:hypothetical protein JD77_04753 [Micromonospora olivasterospora]